MQCDPWWEMEADWHRAWENRFSKEWHEVIHFQPVTNEKHIADVKTDKGLVLEFQHSAITPEEMKAREDFYGNMICIVDGCRGELDAAHFDLRMLLWLTPSFCACLTGASQDRDLYSEMLYNEPDLKECVHLLARQQNGFHPRQTSKLLLPGRLDGSVAACQPP